MRITIHQPQYLPYIGFFHKLMISDTYVVMDNTPFNKGFIHRNRILTPEGSMWLTIPLVMNQGDSIKNVMINNNLNWQQKHLKAIERNYKNAPFFSEIFPILKSTLTKKWGSINDLNVELIKRFMTYLEINIPVVLESTLNVVGVATQRLVNICKAMKAKTYVSGAGTGEYMDTDLFKRQEIDVEIQKFTHPRYEQRFGEDFLPYMGIIDLLFNKGKESINIIRRCGS